MPPLPFILVYLILINLATYGLYWHDKHAAIHRGRRVPEQVLLGFGFAGGTLAALLAMRRMNHKLKKGKFQHRFWALTVVQGCIIVFLPAPLLYVM